MFIFIFATVGLLGWSFIRPWVHKWVEVCALFQPTYILSGIMNPKTDDLFAE